MKKALRIILPIIMILVIVISLVWYLMVYDREFTKSTIVSAARALDKMGNHKASAWCYDLAYNQSEGDEVAIELAEHYKMYGNYTKAERTLTQAIANGPTTDLYIALCQTYVQQDKLRDAVILLDGISDPAIKAEIEKIRPAAPTLMPYPTVYNQYKDVEAFAETGTLYVNFEGDYPSTATDKYEGPYSLPEGQTDVCAIAVDDNDIVSVPVNGIYTIGGIIKPVSFTDETLESMIREELHLSIDTRIYTNDLWPITTLALGEDITTYSDLIYFPYLESLTIDRAGTKDLSVLKSLTNLKELSITSASLNNNALDALSALVNLEKLTLNSCGLSTDSIFKNLTKLQYVDISNNSLGKIAAIENLTQLEALYMPYNALEDLSPLSSLGNLLVLDISNNNVTSLQALRPLKQLKTLSAGSNKLSSLEGISDLTSLESLTLPLNAFSDISALAGCLSLTDLDLSYNEIADITVLENLKSLERVNLSHNNITALPVFTAEHKLASLNMAYNQLLDIEALSVLPDIYFVDIDYNAEVTSLEPLLDSHHLMEVNCYGTLVAVDPFPDDRGVVVNFDPSLIYGEQTSN